AVELLVAIVVGDEPHDRLASFVFRSDDDRRMPARVPLQPAERFADLREFRVCRHIFAIDELPPPRDTGNQRLKQPKRRRRPFRWPAAIEQAVVTVIEKTDGKEKMRHCGTSSVHSAGTSAGVSVDVSVVEAV